MTVTTEGHRPDFMKMAKELDKLNHWEVAVGFFGENDAKLLTIVRANEYGITIKPKPGNKFGGYLMVPYKDENGKQRFYKLKEVVIPPRPFIKNAWDANTGKYKQMVFDGLKDICNGDTTAIKFLNKLGVTCVKDIQEEAVKLKNPPNAPLTIENKNSSNPLVDTGEMIRKVTYKIIPD